MTVLNFTGFESGTAGLETTNGGLTVQGTTKRTGDYAAQLTNSGGDILRGLAATGLPAELGRTAITFYTFFFRVGALPSTQKDIASIRSSAALAVEIRLGTGGALTLHDGGSDESSSAGTLSINTWYRIDVSVISNGACSLQVEEGTPVTLTANNITQDRLHLGCVNLVGGTITAFYDDVVIDDSSFPSGHAIYRMDIDGAGTYTGWTGTFADIDEVPHDSDTTFINSTSTSAAETGTLESASAAGLTLTPVAVKAVAVMREASSDSTLAAVRLRSGSTDSDSTAVDVGNTTYVAVSKLHTVDPNGSVAWTLTALNSVEVGVVKGNDASDVRCTAAWVMVLEVQNSPPIISVAPAVTYVAGSTGVSSDFSPATVTFTAVDAEDTGTDELIWQVRNAASGAGLIVASGLCSSGVQESLSIPYYAPGLILGSQTLYVRVIDAGPGTALTDEESFAFVKYGEILEGDSGVRVDLFDPDGVAVDEGPLHNILAASYSAHLGQIGTFLFTVPTDDERSAVLDDAHGYTAHIQRAGEGLVFKGLIDRIQDVIGTDERKVREVSGSSVGRELVHANTYATALDNVSLSSAVTTLLAGTDWSSGSVGSPGINMTTRFDLRSVWDSLAQLALMSGYYLREDVINRAIDINAFGTNPNSLVFRNVEMVTQELQENNRLVPITGIRVLAESHDVWNRVVPLGQREGISGENLTLELATRSSPYTVASATAQDGSTYWYLEDATSVTAYGRRVKPLLITKIVPLGIGANDEIRAANALYDNAATWLSRHKDPLTTYQVSVLGLKHFELGVALFEVGDKVKVQYRGVALDEAGRRTYLDVDTDLFIMGYTRRLLENGSDAWSFEVGTVARDPASDGALIAEMNQQLQAVQASPVPFVLFGSGTMRLDDNGIQLLAGVSYVTSIWGAGTLTDDPLATGLLTRLSFDYDDSGVRETHGQIQAYDETGGLTEFTVGVEDGISTMTVNGGPTGGQDTSFSLLTALQSGGSRTSTIASGVISVFNEGLYVVDTEAAAASDDLATISAHSSYVLPTGKIIVVRAANSARSVVAKDGTGNLQLAGDCTLDNAQDTLVLMYDGTNWLELCRSNNGA